MRGEVQPSGRDTASLCVGAIRLNTPVTARSSGVRVVIAAVSLGITNTEMLTCCCY